VHTPGEFSETFASASLTIGHLKDFLNIHVKEVKNRLNEFSAYKNKNRILYTFSNNPEAFQSAKLLADDGFTQVPLLCTASGPSAPEPPSKKGFRA